MIEVPIICCGAGELDGLEAVEKLSESEPSGIHDSTRAPLHLGAAWTLEPIGSSNYGMGNERSLIIS